MDEKEPRRRGVRLNDLDRSRLYVVGFTGRRWETIGPLDDVAASLWHHTLSGGGEGEARAPGQHVRQDDAATLRPDDAAHLDH